MTARTRSARRSKPQRMSVASAESHIRASCDPSNARKLGSPIIPPTPSARRVGDWLQIRDPQKDSSRFADESRSPFPPLMTIATTPWPASLPLPQTCRFGFPHTLLPRVESPDRQSPLATKHCRTLAALQLLRKQSTPPRPRFHTRLLHPYNMLFPRCGTRCGTERS